MTELKIDREGIRNRKSNPIGKRSINQFNNNTRVTFIYTIWLYIVAVFKQNNLPDRSTQLMPDHHHSWGHDYYPLYLCQRSCDLIGLL